MAVVLFIQFAQFFQAFLQVTTSGMSFGQLDLGTRMQEQRQADPGTPAVVSFGIDAAMRCGWEIAA